MNNDGADYQKIDDYHADFNKLTDQEKNDCRRILKQFTTMVCDQRWPGDGSVPRISKIAAYYLIHGLSQDKYFEGDIQEAMFDHGRKPSPDIASQNS